MEKILDFCKRLGISSVTYYNIARKLKHRPSEQEILEHKRTAKAGRPRKESF